MAKIIEMSTSLMYGKRPHEYISPLNEEKEGTNKKQDLRENTDQALQKISHGQRVGEQLLAKLRSHL